MALAAVAALFLSSPARADGPSDLEAALSEPVVTTASHAAEDQSTAPATSTTISAEDLRRYGIKTLAEAINFLSLGMITQNNLDDAEIGSRGVLITGDYGDHVLLLVDGHAMNEQWGGTAYFARGAGVPFELIDHIEVILGPGSVLYGSNAMLGVINIVTKRAKDFDGLHFVGEADLFTSGRAAVGFGHEFTLFGKRAELTYEMEYYSQSGPAFTFGPQFYGNDSVTGKPKCFNATCSNAGVWGGTPANQSYWAEVPDGYMRLILGDFELDMRAESYKRALPYAFGAYNQPNQFTQDRFLSADLRHRWAVSAIVQLQSRLYGDLYDFRQDLPSFAAEDCYYAAGVLPGQNRGCTYELFGESRWVGLEEQLSMNWLHDQSLTTLLGVDGRYIAIGMQGDSADLGTYQIPVPGGVFGVFDTAEYRLAAYGQQTWRPLDWLALNAGARFDDDERYGTKLSPRAMTAVNPWPKGTIKVIYSEAFRTPSYFESNYTDNAFQIPNTRLTPETVRSIESSFEQRFGSQRILFGVFDQTYSNVVSDQNAPLAALKGAIGGGVLPPVPKGSTIAATYGPSGAEVEQYQNLSSIDDYGFNAAFEGTAFQRDLRYGINVTGAVSRQNVTNPDGSVTTLPLTVTPQVFGNARISYKLPGALPVVAVAASLVGPRPADDAFGGGWTPLPYAPTTLDLRWTVSGPFPDVPGLSYRLIADYVSAAENPYVVGPGSPTPAHPSAELVPVDQFRTTVGLQYDLK